MFILEPQEYASLRKNFMSQHLVLEIFFCYEGLMQLHQSYLKK